MSSSSTTSLLAASNKAGKVLEFEGSNFLRCRLVLSTLSGVPIRIRDIRPRDESPGLRESEASLIRLFDKITNGSRIEVGETGTAMLYQPGILIGGKLDHDCSTERAIGYYLEPLLSLAPFCKNPLSITLRGVTNNKDDPSPELLKNSALPILKRFFLVDEGLEIRTSKRGCHPGGGGQVHFSCRIISKSLRPLQIVEQGKVKRIRGTAWATRVSPAVANRLVESAKGVLLKYIPDIYIFTDHQTGNKSGKSPGFGLVLTAETTEGAMLSAEVCSNPAGTTPTVPEELGLEGAKMLLEEIYRGGCIDSTCQSQILLHLALAQRDVSKVLLGPLSTYTVHFMKHLRDFFGVTFKLETVQEEEGLRTGADKVLLTCVGIGYTNLSKRTT